MQLGHFREFVHVNNKKYYAYILNDQSIIIHNAIKWKWGKNKVIIIAVKKQRHREGY